ncbi:sigma factor [Hymenobacter monticola]|uniref:RNA polymerase sigma-70 region 2 domain-containing protein n=1 Tax=Hymenobacter monticola TaxID=1705399 RepID=A0ABY4BC87_9BACT|nr:sigma factor [Hymenobacter monticola]UOE36753.1 hypothetical protein MTP16_25485 [Hymenobacter monticola]
MIRPLRIVKTAYALPEGSSASEEVEKASLPPGVPESTHSFVVSVARRYQGQGLSMVELVAAGAAGWQQAQHHFGTALDQFERWGSRWVQESMLIAIGKGGGEARPPA